MTGNLVGVDLRQLAEHAVGTMLASASPCGCGGKSAEPELDEYDAEYDVIVAAGGMPGNLTAYWARGEGAAKIRWGTDGAFDRCVRQLGKYVKDPKGTCANLEKNATGHWPAQKAIESALLRRVMQAVSDSDHDPELEDRLRSLAASLGDPMLDPDQKQALLAAAFPPVEDSDEIPQPPGTAVDEGPMEAEEEKEQANDERMGTIEDRLDRLEQDMARVLSVTNPELETI